MRARNIKPSLFKNEVLGVADPLFTILFEGLWCEADREGRIEDRPMRLRAEIFPYRPTFDIEAGLNWLMDNGFIDRYETDGKRVIQVLTFTEHQRPHANEVASALPTKVASTSHQGRKRAQPRKTQGDKHFALNPSSLIPDSGSLNPDTSNLDADPLMGVDEVLPPEFETLKAIYPQRDGDQGWPKALRACRARLKDGHTWQEILDGAQRYADRIRASGKEHTEFVKQAATFCGPDKHFLNTHPPPKSKADALRSANVDATQEWLERRRQHA